ncbi:MAG TPA: adenylate/guanylate cyclase domain-containing protein [Herpetosiphonaceae bacterium]|nr:adenylate/guanylate cyclase domain-containing protein [Herpetosiphonaceae bacterium]
MSDIERLEQAIAALEAQRALLGDAVVEAGQAPIREKLALLRAQPPAAAEQRKLVTILFADISGFTALSETLDPEEVTGIINALWQRLDAIIVGHGGEIDKHIGDAVMALWSAKAAREDDPERAIRAALAMQAALSTFAVPGGPALRMRIGVHTGPVLLSVVGTVGEFTAMGDSVNLAARLEHAAPLGGVLISHATYNHVRGAFNVAPLEPLSVKGKAEPVRAYRVDSARPRAFRMATRGVEGVETRMIGRDGQLELLRRRFGQAVEERRVRCLTVAGHAGVGKSRLLYEFQSWLDLLPEQVGAFRGRATEQTRARPYGLLRDLVAGRFGLMESDSAATIRAKLERGMGEALGADGVAKAHLLGGWLGYDFAASPHLAAVADPQQLYDQAFGVLAEVCASAAVAGPTVMLLEDLHWADDRSLEALERLAAGLPGLPLLIVALARPTLFERRPDWGAALPGHELVELHRLSREASGQLAAEILQRADAVPQALYDLIAERAEGNPFYVEELIKMLIDDGLIDTDGEPWRIMISDLTELRVPSTLTGVLQARLDSLQPAEKLLLQRASVVGRMFWEDALAFLFRREQPAGGAFPGVLLGLRSRELIYQREQSAFEETREYIFKHALLREVTYESVLKRDRRRYHGQVAQWLTEITGQRERSEEYALLIAEHYEQAGELAAAAGWFQRAGEHAQSLYAPQAAASCLTRAIGALRQLGQEPGPLLHRARGVAHETLGDFEAARADYEAAFEAARLHGQPPAAWQALIDLGLLWASRDYGQTGSYYRQALALARTLGDQAALAHTLSRLGNWYGNTEQFALARQHLEEALGIFRSLDDQPALAGTFDLLGMMHAMNGDFIRSHTYNTDAIALFRQLGDRQSLINCLCGHRMLQTYTMHSETYAIAPRPKAWVLDGLGEALTLARQTGWRGGEAFALFSLGMVLTGYGDFRDAFAMLAEGLAIAEEIDHHQWLTACHIGYGALCLAALAYEQAWHHLELALRLAEQLGSTYWIRVATTALADAAIGQGRYDEAQRMIAACDSDAQAPAHSIAQRGLRCAWAKLALARGDADRTLALIQDLIDTEPNQIPGGVIPALWLMRAQALGLLGRPAEAAALLGAARQTVLAHDARPLLWKVEAELARVYRGLGRLDEAAASAAAARGELGELAAGIADPELREAFLQRAALLLGRS